MTLKKKGAIKKMKEAKSSKWRYMRSTAYISLKWNVLRNADITPNRSYMRSIADILILGAISHYGLMDEKLIREITSNFKT